MVTTVDLSVTLLSVLALNNIAGQEEDPDQDMLHLELKVQTNTKSKGTGLPCKWFPI